MSQVILLNDYKMIKCIGKGSFGKVYLTKRDNDPMIYAAKVLEINATKEMEKYLLNEIKIMKQLKNNENIIHLYELFKTNNHYYFILEYCNGGSLSNILNEYKLKYGKPFPQDVIQFYMTQIVKGVKYIHENNFIHRDLKLDNILVNFDNIGDKNNLNLLASKIKIIDFGLATYKNNAKTLVGSPIYMDPKILRKYDKAGGYDKLQSYDEKADIWSLGAICYEMLTGDTLFNVVTLQQLLEKVEKGDYKIPLYVDLSKEIISFLNCMLQYNGEKRLSAEELLNHPFLSKKVKDFSKPNFEKISYKIINGELEINIKNNKSIWLLFNEEEKNKDIPNSSNFQTINSNENIKINRLNTLNAGESESKINNNVKPFNRNIQSNKDNLRLKKINIKNEIASPNDNRFVEGYASPKKNRMSKNNLFIDNQNKENEEMEGIKNSLIGIEEEEKISKDFRNLKTIENTKDYEKGENLGNYIKALLNEYKSAKEYFKKNNLKINENDANNKCLKIQNIKDQFELGYTFNIKDLPELITPEYIYGCPKQERDNKYILIIKKFLNDINKLNDRMKYFQKHQQSINKEEFEKMKQKLEKLDLLVKKIDNRFKNKWTPAPLFIRKYQNHQVEKISYKNSIFQLKIQIKRIDNKNENINLIISLVISNSKTLRENIHLSNESNFYSEFIWSMNAFEWKNIDNNIENFILSVENEKYIGNIDNKIEFNISKIKFGKRGIIKVKLPTENNNYAILNFNIIPLIPKGEKYLATEVKEYIILKQIYPPFEGKSSNFFNNL